MSWLHLFETIGRSNPVVSGPVRLYLPVLPLDPDPRLVVGLSVVTVGVYTRLNVLTRGSPSSGHDFYPSTSTRLEPQQRTLLGVLYFFLLLGILYGERSPSLLSPTPVPLTTA